MKVDVNKPVEVVVYDCGHEVKARDAEVLSVDGEVAFIKVDPVVYYVVDIRTGICKSDIRVGVRNKKVKTSTRSVFWEVVIDYLDNGWSTQDLWDELLKMGIVEDKEIEV
jgi:hypothetical protein